MDSLKQVVSNETVTQKKKVSGKNKVALEKQTQRKPNKIQILEQLEQKVIWLASWMIYHANYIRPSVDGIKVGGHQASSSSLATIMTALYFNELNQFDKVAVKPHASPIFHAIQYLLDNQALEQLKRFRAFGGAQSYPSRTKDKDDVDFSTGSVGLGVAATLFSSITQDYLFDHQLLSKERQRGRMIALLGDAELDEGNIYEALMEGWKKDLTNTWWFIDYNRQSLDGVMNDQLYSKIEDIFSSFGWQVVTLKYGKKLQAVFKQPIGKALKSWIENCPNQLYSALTFKGGAAWRKKLTQDLISTRGLKAFLNRYSDAELAELMTNLGGHDLEYLLETFETIDHDKPVCFIAYTIKGWQLPLAGHKDNHSGQMTPEQMEALKSSMNIVDGEEWSKFAGLSIGESELESFLGESLLAESLQKKREKSVVSTKTLVHQALTTPAGKAVSTQVVFGKLMQQLGAQKSELSDRLVSASPDVASSTNLSAWLNRRGVYHSADKPDVFQTEQVASPIKWGQTPQGQHIELGIAENNLFTLLGSLGLSEKHFGERLIPIGTLYDPFICRGLDALNYACYQDARFILVATPSGITLAPEGGAHQSSNTPLIAMAQDNLTYYEPAFSDELTVLFNFALRQVQIEHGNSIYFRLSTRSLKQPERAISQELSKAIISGAYWLRPPEKNTELVIAYTGAVAQEALDAWEEMVNDLPGVGLLAVTSSDQLHQDWKSATQSFSSNQSPIEQLLSEISPKATIVSVCDAHPATLSWLASVKGHRSQPLGVDRFGQSGSIPDLYKEYGIDKDAILDACARALITA